jgi:hypothetical protein
MRAAAAPNLNRRTTMRITIATTGGLLAYSYEIDPGATTVNDLGQHIEDALGTAGLCDCDDCGLWVADETMHEFPDGVLVCGACAAERAEEAVDA